jgi:hypothetical protein
VLPVGRADLDRLPLSVRSFLVNPELKETRVADMEAAVQGAGFVPRLPSNMTSPKFSVIASASKQSKIRTAELRTALESSGVRDVVVPEDWNGIELGVQVSAGIGADYGNVYLAQRLPLTLDAPPGFPLDQFLECLLRIAGIGAPDARALRQRFNANPADFLLVGPQYQLETREIQLESGAGVILQSAKDPNLGVMLFWSTPDRIYLLRGSLKEYEAIAVANSIR